MIVALTALISIFALSNVCSCAFHECLRRMQWLTHPSFGPTENVHLDASDYIHVAVCHRDLRGARHHYDHRTPTRVS